MSANRTALLLLVSGLCCGLQATQHAAAQSVESFYRGRTVTMLVGTSPGGINDISARLVARHLSRFLPGNPTIVVQNNPGGGGLVTANRLYVNSKTARFSPNSSARSRSSPSKAIPTPSSIPQNSLGSAAYRPMQTTPI
jgi:tripartite-type tricarboxylate transporter receptor subunit TctC